MATETEAFARKERIDPALLSAGWDIADASVVGLEIPVAGYDPEPWDGVTDYCLYQSNGEVIAVVEAKRQSRNPNVARAQARDYVAEIGKRQSFQPFAFLTNGSHTYFWEVDEAPPRLVAGFFTPDDLENRRYLRENGSRLSQLPINSDIVNRPYQQEAIRRIAETFEDRNRRRALLVMATGTGKTRTTIALIDLFLRGNYARRVLFLADRDALVDQALEEGFKTFLPNEPRLRIYTNAIDPTKRLYVATLQTMGRCYQQFSPGFFDLIVFDEAHRSIFNRFTEVVDYFDARMIGLTATPANFIDRDTFRVFQCDDKTPTFLYSYADAIRDRYLVDFSLYQAKTRFQRDGIKGIELTEEEQNALIEAGIDPEEIDFTGSQIEKEVSNTDTLRRQWEEFMDVCIKDESGQLPGKSIVFAMTKDHAHRLQAVFDEMYPHYHNLAQVITSDTERVRDGSYGDGLISKFKKNDLPRIAISVDMLDTGVDVPEVVNLAFMKPVQSQIKLWQMIGRGTRNDEACHRRERLPNGRKTEFKIIDFWENAFDKQTEDTVRSAMPVLVTIFNTRLRQLLVLRTNPNSPEYKRVESDLRAQIGRIPTDAFTVKREFPEIEPAWTDEFWSYVNRTGAEFLRNRVGPLLRFVAGVDVAAETFTSKVERLKLQGLTNTVSPETLESIVEDVARLPDFVAQDPQLKASVDLCRSAELRSASFQQLTEVIEDLAPQMKNRRETPSAFMMLDLPDFIAASGYITLSDGAERVYVKDYKQRVEERIAKLVDGHATVEAIRGGEPVTDAQLIALERTLRQELGGRDIELTTDNIRKAYGFKLTSFLAFLRQLLDLDSLPDYEMIVQRAFDAHVAQHTYNADQINFLRAVQSVFLQKRRLERADLYEGALARFGDGAVDVLFTPQDVEQLLAMTSELAA